MDAYFAVGVAAFALTTTAYLGALWTAREAVGAAARWMLRVTLAFWAGLIVWWMIDAGLAGGTRTLLSTSAWTLSALYLFLLRRYPIQALGSFITALSTVLAAFALLLVNPYADLVTGPLADWLLRIHIGLAFVGITGFAFATAVSVVYLIQARMLKRKAPSAMRRRLPPLDVLDRLALRSIIVGFPFYTIALLLGSAQAVRLGTGEIKLAYILAVASWLIYGAVLQARLTAGWRGRRAAILTTVGLCAALVVVAQYSLGVA